MEMVAAFRAAGAGAVPKVSDQAGAPQVQGAQLPCRCAEEDATVHLGPMPEAAVPEPACREAVLP